MAMSSSFLSLLVICLLGLLAGDVFAIPEPKTGIDFPPKYQGASLSKVGCRTKGPVKVYACGQYDETFLLKMNMKVGAEKMASALSDALKPRCRDAACIEEFKTIMTKGLPKGCTKGMSLAFVTKGGKVAILANDKSIGSVSSKPLAKAFQGIYTDKKAVCKMTPVE
jgi:hypothetical protein